MEYTVKEEFCQTFNPFNTEQQGSQPARHGRDMTVDKLQKLGSVKNDATDYVDQNTTYCIMCAKSFSSKEAYADHVSIEHNGGCATGGFGQWTEKQTHTHYDLAFQTVKVEAHENENDAEIKEDIYSFELSNMSNSFSEGVNHNTVRLEACSQIKKEEIGGDAPSAINTGTKANLNKGYKENTKVVTKFSSETKHKLTHRRKPFACNICGYKCNQKILFRKHIRTHIGEKPCACNICDYRCSYRSKLKEHLRTHTGEKPFSCTICDYKCSRNSSLSIHIRTHTGEKPYACNICDYTCIQKSKLGQHIKTHTDEKPYACNICDYKCSQKRYLSQHIKTHTGEKPFACDACDYKCSLKSNLRIHFRTHTGEKAFACNICDYKSDRKHHLKRHIRTHTGEKPFACNVCDYKGSHKCNLKKHLQTHTSVKL